ncbi:MAG: hypothetical protein LBS60_00385 [Deltaproteobacteria bacterium]|jgi:hypothetical protein|nr:hypothetical protein [Deltaproteobacteria bacterium]
MSQTIVKTFNAVGPGVAEEHYLLPVLERQPMIEEMIEGKYYFTLRAPRRSGKTTLISRIAPSVAANWSPLRTGTTTLSGSN